MTSGTFTVGPENPAVFVYLDACDAFLAFTSPQDGQTVGTQIPALAWSGSYQAAKAKASEDGLAPLRPRFLTVEAVLSSMPIEGAPSRA